MAAHAYITAELLRSIAPVDHRLLPRRQVGPVTRAIAAIRNEPVTEAEWEAAGRDLSHDLAALMADAQTVGGRA